MTTLKIGASLYMIQAALGFAAGFAIPACNSFASLAIRAPLMTGGTIVTDGDPGLSK
jgi:hypothetical protein